MMMLPDFLTIYRLSIFVCVYQTNDFTQYVFKYKCKYGSWYSGAGFPYIKGDGENKTDKQHKM